MYRLIAFFMGQYYVACYKKPKAKKWSALCPHNYKDTFEGADGKMHTIGQGSKLMEHSFIGNVFVNAAMDLLFRNPMMLVWAGDYADNEPETKHNLHEICEIHKPHLKQNCDDFKLIINHTKKQYVVIDKSEVDKYGYRINPLSLLVAEGNGRGGGDYRIARNIDLVGIWARDVISIDNQIPSDYTELVPDFMETYEPDP